MGTAHGGEWGSCLRLATIKKDQGNCPAAMTTSPVRTARMTTGTRGHTAPAGFISLDKQYAPTWVFVPQVQSVMHGLLHGHCADSISTSPMITLESRINPRRVDSMAAGGPRPLLPGRRKTRLAVSRHLSSTRSEEHTSELQSL